MPPTTWPRFEREILAVYSVSAAPLTTMKMRQVLREVGELPRVKTTADLSPPTIADWLNAHRDRAANTLRGQLAYLRAACVYARSRGYLAGNPFDARPIGRWVRPAKSQRKRHLSLAELATVYAALESEIATWEGHRLFALFATVAFTGLRKNEALHLQCADVSPDATVIDLTQRHRRYKTVDSEQPIPCPDRLGTILRAWIPRTGSRWLFPTKNGRSPWTGGSTGQKPLDRLKAAGSAAGVEGVTFQALRHSWATHAESAWGFGEALIQRVLRHTTTRTQQHYRHADLDNLRRAVAGIDLAPPRGETG